MDREVKEYVAGVGWEETFIRIYHVEKKSIFNKKGPCVFSLSAF